MLFCFEPLQLCGAGQSLWIPQSPGRDTLYFSDQGSAFRVLNENGPCPDILCLPDGFNPPRTIPEEVFESLKREKVILEFKKRLMRNDWSGIDDTKETFSGSRSALLEWAPVVEEFKIQDEEIVSNSIHFKWLRVCQEFEKLTDFEKIQLEEDSDLRDRKQEIPEGS